MIDANDDRLGIPPENNEEGRTRLSLNRSDGRKDRAADSREAEDAEMTDDERFAMFLSTSASVLPSLPSIPGYRCIWLSTKTSNGSDSIHTRAQMGYEPLKPEEAPGLTSLAQNSGEFAGLISVNEMVAYKVSERLYQRFMRHYHHELPRREEEAIREAAEKFQQQAEAAGSRTAIGDGTTEIMNSRDREAIISD